MRCGSDNDCPIRRPKCCEGSCLKECGAKSCRTYADCGDGIAQTCCPYTKTCEAPEACKCRDNYDCYFPLFFAPLTCCANDNGSELCSFTSCEEEELEIVIDENVFEVEEEII